MRSMFLLIGGVLFLGTGNFAYAQRGGHGGGGHAGGGIGGRPGSIGGIGGSSAFRPGGISNMGSIASSNNFRPGPVGGVGGVSGFRPGYVGNINRGYYGNNYYRGGYYGGGIYYGGGYYGGYPYYGSGLGGIGLGLSYYSTPWVSAQPSVRVFSPTVVVGQGQAPLVTVPQDQQPGLPSGETGMKITSLVEDGPAAKAALRVGDVILSVGTDRIQTFNNLRDVLGQIDGKEVEVVFINGENGKREKLPVKVINGVIGVNVEQVDLPAPPAQPQP